MSDVTQGKPERIFQIEQRGDTIIVCPVADLRELDFQRIEAEAAEILKLLNGGPVSRVVMDFHQTDSFGSTALGFFVKLWTKVQRRAGHMAFCNLSENERELLQITKLDGLW